MRFLFQNNKSNCHDIHVLGVGWGGLDAREIFSFRSWSAFDKTHKNDCTFLQGATYGNLTKRCYEVNMDLCLNFVTHDFHVIRCPLMLPTFRSDWKLYFTWSLVLQKKTENYNTHRLIKPMIRSAVHVARKGAMRNAYNTLRCAGEDNTETNLKRIECENVEDWRHVVQDRDHPWAPWTGTCDILHSHDDEYEDYVFLGSNATSLISPEDGGSRHHLPNKIVSYSGEP